MNRNRSHQDDSDNDSLTEDLEKIGGFPSIAELSSTFTFNLPSLPDFPNFSKTTLTQLPNLPELPNLPNLPNLPELAQLKAFINEYNASTNKNVNYLKTSILSRIQMSNFLNDLNLGISFQNAIERLKPLADIIHATINLPAEDYDEGEEELKHTEPVGVEPLVNKHQPILNELIIPQTETNKLQNQLKKHGKGKLQIMEEHMYDNENASGDQIESIDGLTIDQIKELTEIESSKDFNDQSILRTKIQKIQSLENVSQASKNKLVTRLMMGNYYKYLNEHIKTNILDNKSQPRRDQREPEIENTEISEHSKAQDSVLQQTRSEGSESDSEDEVVLAPHDKIPTYFSTIDKILGCQHYQRKCKLECATCFQWYTCRFCHDAKSNHQMERNKVKHILCMECFEPQFPSSNCENCDVEFANYYCDTCILYDDDPTKDIYHCDDCGICRLGLGLGQDFFHCKGCNACLSIDLEDSHKCMENSTQSDCPICNEYMFTSTKTVVFMNCGHTIHQSCFDEYTKHSYKCPICSKTITNMETQFRVLDQEIAYQPLPMPYKEWRCIISCNDCKGKSSVGYHALGLRCENCRSYNTAQLKLIKPEECDAEWSIDDGEKNTQVYTSNNLNSNFNINETHITEKTETKDIDEDQCSSDSEDEDSMIKFRKSIRSSNENVSSFSNVINNFINSARGIADDNENKDSDYESYDSEDNIGGF